MRNYRRGGIYTGKVNFIGSMDSCQNPASLTTRHRQGTRRYQAMNGAPRLNKRRMGIVHTWRSMIIFMEHGNNERV